MKQTFSVGRALRTAVVLMLSMALIFSASFGAFAESGSGEGSKYANDALWAFKETDKDAKVDTFFLAPVAATSENNNEA